MILNYIFSIIRIIESSLTHVVEDVLYDGHKHLVAEIVVEGYYSESLGDPEEAEAWVDSSEDKAPGNEDEKVFFEVSLEILCGHYRESLLLAHTFLIHFLEHEMHDHIAKTNHFRKDKQPQIVVTVVFKAWQGIYSKVWIHNG